MKYSPAIDDVKGRFIVRETFATGGPRSLSSKIVDSETMAYVLDCFGRQVDTIGPCASAHPLQEVSPRTNAHLEKHLAVVTRKLCERKNLRFRDRKSTRLNS